MQRKLPVRLTIGFTLLGVFLGFVGLPVQPAGATEFPPTIEQEDLAQLVAGAHVERRSSSDLSQSADDAEVSVSVAEVAGEDQFSVVFPASLDFEMLGFTADTEGQLPRSARVRTSVDGKSWGQWFTVTFDSGDVPDGESDTGKRNPARPGSPPVYTGPSRWVQLESAGDPRSLEVAFLDLDGSARSVPQRIFDALAAVFKGSSDEAGAFPNIITRAQWGADESWRAAPPSYGQVKIGIVHHTEGSNDYSPSQSAGIIRGIYSYHVFSRGWNDIGYNFLVDKYGQIFEGRFGGVQNSVIGAHAGGFNTYSTGVSVLGSHISVPPSAEAMAAFESILLWKLSIHNVWPAGQTWIESQGGTKWPAGTPVLMRNVSGHQDASATDCPGSQLYVRIPDLANRIAARWPILLQKPPPLAVDPQPPYWDLWAIARGVTSDPASNGGVTLDGWGGIHPWGGASVNRAGAPYWHGWDIAWDIARDPTGTGGVTLDGFGGLHTWGGATVDTRWGPYWKPWSIARALALNPSGPGGWVLDGWGGLHSFGGAPPLNASGAPYWPGWDIARDLVLNPSGPGGWVLDAWGGLHPFGGAPQPGGHPYWLGREFAQSYIPSEPAWGGASGYTTDVWGGVHTW
ncbi:MAG: N-acetylmuramoyl-L-alanine amidase [Acidimicrobiia bacterium]|nr:N-acetylmuramoyl-L-alanine amidase [Acidimicrobiia bacterium]